MSRNDPEGAIAIAAPRTELPLVSVVVVNYNYGRFLGEAVASVFGQSYPHVECVVVDNASTDETPAVLAALEARFPQLVTVRRVRNDGQTPASLDGLAASHGHYVIFLDADDYLLPHCAETHVFVHLSMRPHIGFTSGDMLQVQGRHVVVANGEETGRYIRRGRGRRPKLVRPYTATPGWPSAAVFSGGTAPWREWLRLLIVLILVVICRFLRLQRLLHALALSIFFLPKLSLAPRGRAVPAPSISPTGP